MAGDLNLVRRRPLATWPLQESEAAYTKAMCGRRFDDPGTESDWVTLLHINKVDPNDFPEW